MRRENIQQSQEYIPLEYIESVDSQYIDTGVMNGENLDFELVVKQRNTNTNYMFFGARYRNSYDEETLLWAPADNLSNPLRLGYKSTMYFVPLTREEWHTITMDGNKLYVDGVQVVSFTKSTFTRKYSVFFVRRKYCRRRKLQRLDLLCICQAV